MESEPYRIVFDDEDGYPRELISPEERSKAIATGVLKPDTMVTLYRDKAAPVALRAADAPGLQQIFAPPDPPPAIDLSSAHVPSPPQPAAADDPALAAVPEDAPKPVTSPDFAPFDDETFDVAAAPRRGFGARALPPLIAISLVILVVVWLANVRPSRDPATTPGAAAYTATTDVNVRDTPSKSGTIVGTISRGAKVVGVIKPATAGPQLWLELNDGEYRGKFIWSGNLAPVAPE